MATVEFVGLPGSGKSTLHRALARRGPASGLQAVSVFESSGRLRRFVDRALVIMADAIRRPAHFLRRLRRAMTLRAQLRVGSWTPTINWLFVCALLRRPSARALRVMDQGLFQGLVSFAFRSKEDALDSQLAALVEPELSHLADTHIVVCVRAADDIARLRLEARVDGGSPLDRAARPNWSAAISGVDRVTAVVDLMTRRFPHVRSLEVRTDDFDFTAVDTEAAKLLDELHRLASPAPPPPGP